MKKNVSIVDSNKLSMKTTECGESSKIASQSSATNDNKTPKWFKTNK